MSEKEKRIKFINAIIHSMMPEGLANIDTIRMNAKLDDETFQNYIQVFLDNGFLKEGGGDVLLQEDIFEFTDINE